MAREVRRPAPQAAPSPAFSPVRSRGLALRVLAQAEPGRPGDSGRACRLRSALGVLRPRLPWPGRHSAWLRRGASGLAGSPGSAAAARVTATPRLRRGPALPPAAAARAATHPHLRAPPDARRRRVVLAGPAEVWPRPSAPGLPRLELRATRRPLLLLLPCPPAGPPPPSAAAAAACTTQPPPSRRPSAAPRPPGFTGSGDRGAKLWGREGRNAPPSASGAGEPRNRRRHRPASGGAGGAPKPPARRPGPPLRGEAPLGAGISTCDPWPLLPER